MKLPREENSHHNPDVMDRPPPNRAIARAAEEDCITGLPLCIIHLLHPVCRKRRIGGTVHTMSESEASFEEVAAGDLTYGPAEESGTVVADIAILVGWLVC